MHYLSRNLAIPLCPSNLRKTQPFQIHLSKSLRVTAPRVSQLFFYNNISILRASGQIKMLKSPFSD